MDNQVRQKSINLQTNLSLFQLLKDFCWFDKSNKTVDDHYQLGWRFNNPGDWPAVVADKLTRNSAEAAAALSAIHSIFESQRPLLEKKEKLSPCEEALTISSEVSPWIKLPSGGSTMCIREVDVTNHNDISRIVDGLVTDILSLQEHAKLLQKLSEVIRRILTEALLNVHEHAHDRGNKARAWISVTCLSSKSVMELYRVEETLTAEEKLFIKSLNKKALLEIAIADAGLGIPRTLSEFAKDILPEVTKEMNGMSSGEKAYDRLRARAHAHLCYYSFSHYSTSKNETTKKFKTPEHASNWRGLYRCYRQVALLGGSTTVTSGRGRAGYVASAKGILPFRTVTLGERDLPGTTLTFRIPLPAQSPRQYYKNNAQDPTIVALENDILDLDKIDRNKKYNPAEKLIFIKDLTFVAVALPFVELINDDNDSPKWQVRPFARLRQAIQRIEHHLIPVFCFGSLPKNWKESIRSVTADLAWHPTVDGPPRLVGFHFPGNNIQWAFAGAIPGEAESALLDLEERGKVLREGLNDVAMKLLSEIVSHHPNAVTYNATDFRIVNFNADISSTDYHRILTSAFSQYWKRPEVQEAVVTAEKGKVIVLPTGTSVREHFSVFKLLHQSLLLTAALGKELCQKLDLLFQSRKIVILLDKPASRYIAHALLETMERKFSIFTLDELRNGNFEPGNLVLFADCIFKGDTVKRTIREVESLGYKIDNVLSVVDLRDGEKKVSFSGIPSFSLIETTGFKGEVVEDPAGYEKIQTDAITNVPLKETASTFVKLTESDERKQLLLDNPGLFCVGFHIRGGRTHTFSLPLGKMLSQESGKSSLSKWLSNSAIKSLEKLGKTIKGKDVVIFTWFDSRMSGLIEQAAASLREAEPGINGIFSVKMPIVYQGSDIVYPRAGSDALSGCVEIGTDTFTFAGRARPEHDYVAIYLADGAVTGNSLREFLYRIAKTNDPKAETILAIAGVNRLSPAEVRFFKLCKNLEGNNKRTVAFAYDYLFTLQIRSRVGRGPIWNYLHEAVLKDPSLRIAELREYIDQLSRRIEPKENDETLLHLFCPNAKPEIVPYDVVLFRHLLALNQQNEPVVIEILTLLEKLTSKKSSEPTLLSILALEPLLLRDPPLRQFARNSIISFAIEIIKDPLLSEALKSDALAVIAGFHSGLKQHLKEIADIVFTNPILRRQLVALLLVQQREQKESAETLLESCFTGLPNSVQHVAEHLVNIVSVCTEIQDADQDFNPETVYRNKIQLLGSSLLHHAEALEQKWDAVNPHLHLLTEEWDINPPDSVRKGRAIDMVRSGCDFAEKVVMPGFSSLAYFAREQGKGPLADRLQDSAVTAIDMLKEIRRQLPENPHNLDSSLARQLADSFERMRKATWYTPSFERLSRGDYRSKAGGVLSESLEEIFCSPSNLLINVAEGIFGATTKFEKMAEFVGGLSPRHITICPVPNHSLQHIFNLLLRNIKERTVGLNFDVIETDGFPRSDGENTHSWAVEIINSIDQPKNGDGQGLAMAKSIAMKFNIVIDSGEIAVDKWRTRIVIPNCFYLKPQNELK